MTLRRLDSQIWSYPVKGVSVVIEVRGYMHRPGQHPPPDRVLLKLALEDALRRIKGFEPRYPAVTPDVQESLEFEKGGA